MEELQANRTSTLNTSNLSYSGYTTYVSTDNGNTWTSGITVRTLSGRSFSINYPGTTADAIFDRTTEDLPDEDF